MSDTSPLVSIVIPTLNEDIALPILYNCLSHQTVRNFEVLVADSSTDDAVSRLCDMWGITRVPGGLPGKARNEGAKLSSGKYLLFLDADVQINPEFIETAVKQIRETKSDAISFAFVPTPPASWFLRLAHSFANLYFSLTTNIGFPHGLGGALLVDRYSHQQIGGFDETLSVAEDQEYIRRLSIAYKYAIVTEPLVGISVRRFVSTGTLRMCLTWTLIELHRIFVGEIRHDKIPYFKPRKE
jgi:glycosyltransferase involved in cell wall biosynthesis